MRPLTAIIIFGICVSLIPWVITLIIYLITGSLQFPIWYDIICSVITLVLVWLIGYCVFKAGLNKNNNNNKVNYIFPEYFPQNYTYTDYTPQLYPIYDKTDLKFDFPEDRPQV